MTEALIFAAGEGRRLRPLTQQIPKALVDIGGQALLERVARKLVAAGAERVVINAHYLADQVSKWAEGARIGAEIVVSREDLVSDRPLDTAGGLRHAAPLFCGDGPFFVHNADVWSDVDLGALYESHVAGESTDDRFATLVVMERQTTRPLLLDALGVYGRRNLTEGWEEIAREPVDGPRRVRAFCGIHVLSRRVLDMVVDLSDESIIKSHMRWIGQGERIDGYDVTGASWHDIGTAQRLEEARIAVSAGATEL